MTLHVSAHAIERYQERVANLPDSDVREALTSPAVLRAADFGAPYVRLATGQRIVIEGRSIVTVLPRGTFPGTLDARRGRMEASR